MGKHNSFENSMIRHEISRQLHFFPQNHQASFRIKEVGNQPEIQIGKTMGTEGHCSRSEGKQNISEGSISLGLLFSNLFNYGTYAGDISKIIL